MRTIIGAVAAAMLVHGAALADPGPPPPDQHLRQACKIRDVSVFPDRIHILCGPSGQTVPGGYYPSTDNLYLATEIGDPIADKVVTIASAAWVANRVVIAEYMASKTKNPAGCLAADCRRIVALRILPY